jgi:hypothetical protein
VASANWWWLLPLGVAGLLLLPGNAGAQAPAPAQLPPAPKPPTLPIPTQPTPPRQPTPGRWLPVQGTANGVAFQQGRRYRYLPGPGDLFGPDEQTRVAGLPARNVVRTYQLGDLVSAIEFEWAGDTGFYQRTSLVFDNGERLEVWEP